jgi:hypothetical protein
LSRSGNNRTCLGFSYPEIKEKTMQTIKVGNAVEWTWGRSKARGKVEARFTRDVTRTIKGKRIKRKADGQEPAFLIRQTDGARVLKSQSEVEKTDD